MALGDVQDGNRGCPEDRGSGRGDPDFVRMTLRGVQRTGIHGLTSVFMFGDTGVTERDQFVTGSGGAPS